MVADHVRDERGAVTMRRAVEGRAHADRALECLLRSFELRIARVEPPPLVVVVGVIAEQLAVRVERARDLGVGVDGLAHLEERSLHAGLVEYAHDRERGAEVGPVIEGQRDLVVRRGPVRDPATEPVGGRRLRTHVHAEADGYHDEDCGGGGVAQALTRSFRIAAEDQPDAAAEDHREDRGRSEVAALREQPHRDRRDDAADHRHGAVAACSVEDEHSGDQSEHHEHELDRLHGARLRSSLLGPVDGRRASISAKLVRWQPAIGFGSVCSRR